MTRPRSTTRLMRCALVVSLAAGAASVQAQQGAEKRLELDEIIMTAERREQSLQDTPVSIVALGAADLENRGIRDIVELRSSIPNVQLAPHPTSASTVRIWIRGVGNNDDQITRDPSVAIYLDGAYIAIARSQGLSMEVADLDAFGFRETPGVGNRDLLRSLTWLNVPGRPHGSRSAGGAT